MYKYWVFLLLILFSMSLYDVKELKVKNIHLVLLTVPSLILLDIFKIKFIIIFSIILYIIGISFKEYIGGGDIKTYIILTFAFDFYIMYVLLYSSFLGMIYIKLFKKEKIAFIPFIFIASIITIYIMTN